MFLRIVFLLCVVSGISHSVFAQDDDFCDAVTTIMRDAPNKFRNIKGRTTNSSFNAITWESGIHVPGTISSRFVVSMGSFYEGGFIQTADKNALREVYEKYKSILSACLVPLGYTLTYSANFYPGLGDYKKVAYMPELKEGPLPPHVTLEATYSKDMGKYTLVMFIFEH